MSDIFLPLRGNLNYFEQRSNNLQLIEKLKLSILLFDKIYLQAGGYKLSVNEHGAFETNIPPQSIDSNEFLIPETPKKHFSIGAYDERTGKFAFGIPDSPDSKNYFTSFQPLYNQLKLNNSDFIELVGIDVINPTEINKLIEKNKDLKQFISGNKFYQNKILANLMHSIYYSSYFNIPVSLDNNFNEILNKFKLNGKIYTDSNIDILNQVNKTFGYKLPDFSSLPIDEIISLRKDKTFNNLRKYINDLNEQFKTQEYDKVEDLHTTIITDYMSEMKEFAPTQKEIAINSFTGLAGLIFPPAGLATTGITIAKDAYKYADYKERWFTYIMDRI